MFGLETLFCWVPWSVRWALSWLPRRGRLHVFQAGVRVSGSAVSRLAPGTYWWFPRWSEIYTDNVVRKVKAIPTETLTTMDGVVVRVGGVMAFSITDIEKWLLDNESSDECVLVDAARILRAVVAEKKFEDLQSPPARKRREDDVTRAGQEGLGSKFGIRVEYLGFTTFCRTVAQDITHSGIPAGTTPVVIPEGDRES